MLPFTPSCQLAQHTITAQRLQPRVNHCRCPGHAELHVLRELLMAKLLLSGLMSSLLAAGGRRTAPSTIAAAKPGASHAIGRHSSHPHLHLHCSQLERSQHVRRSLHKLQHECCIIAPASHLVLAALSYNLRSEPVCVPSRQRGTAAHGARMADAALAHSQNLPGPGAGAANSRPPLPGHQCP